MSNHIFRIDAMIVHIPGMYGPFSFPSEPPPPPRAPEPAPGTLISGKCKKCSAERLKVIERHNAAHAFCTFCGHEEAL